jgi:hypothetical protein
MIGNAVCNSKHLKSKGIVNNFEQVLTDYYTRDPEIISAISQLKKKQQHKNN